MYDNSQKYRWDNENVREYKIKEAVAETEKRVTHSVAERMKNLGFSAKDIAATTGLSEEGIEKL